MMDWWLVLVGLATVIWLGLLKLDRSRVDPKEPPAISHFIPYVGHVLGIFRHGQSYYTRMSSISPTPIYTLLVPGNRIYVVNSAPLVTAVDRKSKTISFDPYVVQFVKRIAQPSPHGLQVIKDHLEEDAATVRASIAPGEGLESTTKAALESVEILLKWDSPTMEEVKGKTFDLFKWMRGIVTRASTDALWGAEKNPFQDPTVEAAFWAVDKDFLFLGLDIAPNVLAPKASRSRQLIFDAFEKYYSEQKGQNSASHLVQNRYHCMAVDHSVSETDIAHFDLNVCYAILTNTVPATAWALYYIYSSPELLLELRRLLTPYIRSTTANTGEITNNVDLSIVTAKIPLLSSIVHETLRLQSTNAQGRLVVEDTIIEDTYLLKASSILLIPSKELHSDPTTWGPNHATFDASRFVNRKPSASVYRAFGAGAAVCPGRYFAVNEMVALITEVVCRYDLLPVGQGDGWAVPKCTPHITTSILTPDDGVPVRVSEQKGMEGKKWVFSWGSE